MLSLAKQSQAQFLLLDSELNGVNSLSFNLSSVGSDGTVSSDMVTFDLDYNASRLFWQLG